MFEYGVQFDKVESLLGEYEESIQVPLVVKLHKAEGLAISWRPLHLLSLNPMKLPAW
jgi:hypothetical protein